MYLQPAQLGVCIFISWQRNLKTILVERCKAHYLIRLEKY